MTDWQKILSLQDSSKQDKDEEVIEIEIKVTEFYAKRNPSSEKLSEVCLTVTKIDPVKSIFPLMLMLDSIYATMNLKSINLLRIPFLFTS